MPKNRTFKTSNDVRRFLGYLINAVLTTEVKPEVAGKLAYIANILLHAIEGSELENRISKLEETFGKGIMD